MPTYIGLLRYTEQGIKAIKDSPKRREAAAKAIASLGGKLVHSYLTLGRYDVVFAKGFSLLATDRAEEFFDVARRIESVLRPRTGVLLFWGATHPFSATPLATFAGPPGRITGGQRQGAAPCTGPSTSPKS